MNRLVNCQANHSREQKRGENTHQILTKYLKDPKKIKDIDGNITLGADFAPTREELYQDIFRQGQRHGVNSHQHVQAVLTHALNVIDPKLSSQRPTNPQHTYEMRPRCTRFQLGS